MWALLSSYCSEYLYVGGVLVFLPGWPGWLVGCPGGCCCSQHPDGVWPISYHTKYEMTRQDHSFDEILSSSTVISGLAWWWGEIRRYWCLLDGKQDKTRYWLAAGPDWPSSLVILSCLLLEKNIMQTLNSPQSYNSCLLFKYWHGIKESKTFSKNSY